MTRLKNKTCHYCRRNCKTHSVYKTSCKNRICKQTYCQKCLFDHLAISIKDFENSAKCPVCKNDCCCSYDNCTLIHQHCFTYKRTAHRHYKHVPKWTKNRKIAKGNSNLTFVNYNSYKESKSKFINPKFEKTNVEISTIKNPGTGRPKEREQKEINGSRERDDATLRRICDDVNYPLFVNNFRDRVHENFFLEGSAPKNNSIYVYSTMVACVNTPIVAHATTRLPNKDIDTDNTRNSRENRATGGREYHEKNFYAQLLVELSETIK